MYIRLYIYMNTKDNITITNLLEYVNDNKNDNCEVNNQQSDIQESDPQNDPEKLEDSQAIIDLFNAFLTYYKNLRNVGNEKENLFEGIDPSKENSVNVQLEIFNDYVIEYEYYLDSEIPPVFNDDPKNNKLDSLYMLMYNDQIKYSQTFLSLLIYVTRNGWTNTKWKIMKIK